MQYEEVRCGLDFLPLLSVEPKILTLTHANLW